MALLGYYRFNGNSNDASGNGYNGTDTAITYSQANGILNGGAGFNGTTSKIILSGGVNGSTARTYSFLIYLISYSDYRVFYTSGLPGAGNEGKLWNIGVNYPVNGAIYLSLNDTDFNTGNTPVLIQNKWHHVVVKYDGGILSTSTVHVYVDTKKKTLGKLGASTLAANTYNGNYGIGYDSSVANRNTNMCFDDFKVQNTSMPVSWIKNEYLRIKGFF